MIARRSVLALPAAALFAAGFRARPGLALYSLRYQAQKDLPATLALAKRLGFEEVEAGNFYGRSAGGFRDLLRTAGLRAASMSASYESLGNQIEEVAANAKTLDAEYVVCSTIPHSAKHLAERDCPPAAENLNRWGKNLHNKGLRLCYHTHGTEFDPSPDGTRFDTLAKLTDPNFVNFEMDIFWIVYGFQDPVQLLRRYPKRFPLMHVKDIRKGTVLGGSPADVREDESVPLGTGMVNVREALMVGQESGVKHFFLEEEAVDAVPQIRESLRYLSELR
jgi:sugar phosphate isomerase/epimerase